jgi:hypothetical protein
MMEDDGLRVLRAPVFVEDRRAIIRGDRAHLILPGVDVSTNNLPPGVERRNRRVTESGSIVWNRGARFVPSVWCNR